jgi:hypothetical protein
MRRSSEISSTGSNPILSIPIFITPTSPISFSFLLSSLGKGAIDGGWENQREVVLLIPLKVASHRQYLFSKKE